MNAAEQLTEALRAVLAESRVSTPTPVAEWLDTRAAAAALGISRATLDEMVARAPSNLPGAPLIVGKGGQRVRRRWDGARLVEWLTAYRTWLQSNSPGKPMLVVTGPAFEANQAEKPARKPRPADDGRGPRGRRPSLLAQVIQQEDRKRGDGRK